MGPEGLQAAAGMQAAAGAGGLSREQLARSAEMLRVRLRHADANCHQSSKLDETDNIHINNDTREKNQLHAPSCCA